MNARITSLLAGLLSVQALPTATGQPVRTRSAYTEEVRAGLEEIFVFRTTRTQHHQGGAPACASAPFHPVDNDYYALWSIGLQAADSRVVDTHERAVGGFSACFGPLARDRPLEMYATGSVAHIPWTGSGECLVTKAQPPVRTALAFTCRLALSGLPDAYAGGLVVSSTLAPFISKTQSPSAHVPGYLSTSVVVMRLWKKPAQVNGRGAGAQK